MYSFLSFLQYHYIYRDIPQNYKKNTGLFLQTAGMKPNSPKEDMEDDDISFCIYFPFCASFTWSEQGTLAVNAPNNQELSPDKDESSHQRRYIIFGNYSFSFHCVCVYVQKLFDIFCDPANQENPINLPIL